MDKKTLKKPCMIALIVLATVGLIAIGFFAAGKLRGRHFADQRFSGSSAPAFNARGPQAFDNGPRGNAQRFSGRGFRASGPSFAQRGGRQHGAFGDHFGTGMMAFGEINVLSDDTLTLATSEDTSIELSISEDSNFFADDGLASFEVGDTVVLHYIENEEQLVLKAVLQTEDGQFSIPFRK